MARQKMVRPMNLLHLEYFKVLAEYQSITKAANHLLISQPALSQMLQKLELEVGHQLFDRKGRHLVLNPYGEALLERTCAIFNEIEQIEMDFSELDLIFTKSLKIGSNNYTLILNWLKSFLANTPDINLQHKVMNLSQLASSLGLNEIDFAFSVRKLDYKQKIISKHLYSDKYVVLAPLSHALSKTKIVSMQSLKNEKFVASPKSPNMDRYIDDLSQKAGFVPNIIFEGETGLQLQIFKDLNALKIHLDSQINDLPPCHIIEIAEDYAHFDVFLSWNKDRPFNTTSEVFFDSVNACFFSQNSHQQT